VRRSHSTLEFPRIKTTKLSVNKLAQIPEQSECTHSAYLVAAGRLWTLTNTKTLTSLRRLLTLDGLTPPQAFLRASLIIRSPPSCCRLSTRAAAPLRLSIWETTGMQTALAEWGMLLISGFPFSDVPRVRLYMYISSYICICIYVYVYMDVYMVYMGDNFI